MNNATFGFMHAMAARHAEAIAEAIGTSGAEVHRVKSRDGYENFIAMLDRPQWGMPEEVGAFVTIDPRVFQGSNGFGSVICLTLRIGWEQDERMSAEWKFSLQDLLQHSIMVPVYYEEERGSAKLITLRQVLLLDRDTRTTDVFDPAFILLQDTAQVFVLPLLHLIRGGEPVPRIAEALTAICDGVEKLWDKK